MGKTRWARCIDARVHTAPTSLFLLILAAAIVPHGTVLAAESAVIARVPDKKSASRVYADGQVAPLAFVGTGRGSGAIYAGEDFPAPSPDGRYVAYVRDRALRLLDTAAGLDRQIYPRAGGDGGDAAGLLITSWSVDGTKLLFYRAGAETGSYWTYSVTHREITPLSLPAGFLAWVHDDEFILEDTATSGRRTVVRWRMTDARPRPFLTGPDNYHQFRSSRDGRTLVALASAPGRGQIVRIDVASGAITPVSPPGKWAEYQWPVLSPSGSRVAYFHRRGMTKGIISGDVVVDGKPVAAFKHYGKIEWVTERVLAVRDECSFRVVDTQKREVLSTRPVLDGFSGAAAAQCQDNASGSAPEAEPPRFDYQSYPPRDLDEVIAKAPVVESLAESDEGRAMLPALRKTTSQATLRIVRPQKMKLQVILDALPEPVENRTSLPQPPHEYALRAIGWNPPPAANTVVRVRSLSGKRMTMHIQDVLVTALRREVRPGEKMNVYGLLFYFDKGGPGIIINEFAKE